VGINADTLELKNGQVVEGNYQGGTAQTLRFQTGSETKVFQRGEVVALTLTGAAPASNPSGSGAGAAIGGEVAAAIGAGAGQSGKTITVPVGTALQVRMVDGVDLSRDQAGKRFTGTLEANLSVNGVVIAPAGTAVHGQLAQAQQAGRRGSQERRVSQCSARLATAVQLAPAADIADSLVWVSEDLKSRERPPIL
jgi:hypothetical protein